MQEIKRIPVSLENMYIVYHYGIIRGYEYMIRHMNYIENERKAALRMLYEMNVKPTADLVREIFGIENAVSFDPKTMEFVVYDSMSDDVQYDNSIEQWEQEYGKKYTTMEKI